MERKIIKDLRVFSKSLCNLVENMQHLTTVLDTWFNGGTISPAEKKQLMDWLYSRNTNSETRFQLSIKHDLQPYLSALLNGSDENNQTLLHCCISKMSSGDNHRSVDLLLVSTLCKFGASIIADDCDGKSPLGIALTKKRMDVVEALLFFGNFSVTESNGLGQTVLYILLDKYDNGLTPYGKYRELIDDLIFKGADLNKPDKDGVTPVHLVAKSLDTELLREFVKWGARLDCRTNAGDDLLTIVCKNIVDKTVECKTTKTVVKHTNVPETLAFIDQLFLNYGHAFDANRRNDNDFAPLHYAFKSDNVLVAQTLMSAGANAHAVASDDTNPLHAVAILSSFEMMTDLIKRGVDWNRRDNVYGFTLIHAAALGYDERKCKWLVKRGFDPDDLANSDLTPLHLAAMIGNSAVVEKLIGYGARVFGRDSKFWYTALHLAAMRGRFATIQEINETSSNDDNLSLVSHCFNSLGFKTNPRADYAFAACLLLEAGANVNARDVHGCTPLHYAAKQSDGELVEMLLKAGAHVDVQDDKYFTPLHNCLLNNNELGLKCLLLFGANVNDVEHPTEDILREIRKPKSSTGLFVAKHLVAMKVAELLMNDVCRTYVTDFGDKGYEIKCLDELKKLKMWMVAPNVSVWDLMHGNFRRRVDFVKNLSDNLAIEFPYYHILIKSRCNEAVNRIKLMDKAQMAYEALTGRRWPDLCVEYILSFLNNRTLRNLIRSVTESEFFNMMQRFKYYGFD